MTPAPGRPRLLYVTEKSGTIRVLRDGEVLPKTFLDISGLVADQGEQGLLSAAFAPDFARTRRFYVYYSASAGCNARPAARSASTSSRPAAATPLAHAGRAADG